eukprot:11179415-Lingulodinium_polyedra.AAC.1
MGSTAESTANSIAESTIGSLVEPTTGPRTKSTMGSIVESRTGSIVGSTLSLQWTVQWCLQLATQKKPLRNTRMCKHNVANGDQARR